jgi:hypothetical protein
MQAPARRAVGASFDSPNGTSIGQSAWLIRAWPTRFAIGGNYNIVAGNRYGPIIDITSNATIPGLGNSAVSTLATTDPWANFVY